MKNIYRIGLIMLSVVCGLWAHTFAQTVTNVTSTQVNKTIQVSYDLDKQADITLHISTDGGMTYQQLNQVSGDVGKNVSAGHKTIIWDVLAERERLVGEDIVFKVKVEGLMSFMVKGVAFTMIYVKGGTFIMGCTSEQERDCNDNEKPEHSVTLSDFYMGETEVTQALWQAVMGNNPSYFKGDDRPVEKVSWNDCQEFIRKLNQLTGKNFRLPTEAQWEYAARGGNKSKDYKYAGGNNIRKVAWAWYWNNPSKGKTHPVKGKHTNELGLYDMTGNVEEWCQDWYGIYSDSEQTNPSGSPSGSRRVIRGGNWFTPAVNAGISSRESGIPNYCNISLGFRISL